MEDSKVNKGYEGLDCQWNGRRSPILAINGVTASSQSLATEIGIKILRDGGNAVDACVAMGAALNVTQPTSTGIGGDCFCLFYDSKTKKVRGLNSSGRSPSNLTIERLKNEFKIEKEFPKYSVHTITVPGTAAGWVESVENFGSGNLTLKQILQPSIDLAEKGYPVHPFCSYQWKQGEELLKKWPNSGEMLIEGRAPKSGEIFKMPYLANTFKLVAEHGKKGFYEGKVAESIVEAIRNEGGVMTLEDLKNHQVTFDDPICVDYKGHTVWEIPPNGQGITALMALNILSNITNLNELEHNSPEYLHYLIESLRLAFADSRGYVTDLKEMTVKVKDMLSKEYSKKRFDLIDKNKSNVDVEKGTPFSSSDTVYLCAVDKDGNACSFIQSNYTGFGSGLIPKGCGFTLQNRGSGFSLDPNHPNCLQPNKRPYHTIIPGMVTKGDNLYCPFGVMGGFMQPQGHVQVLLNMIEFGMDPQLALDKPRFCITDGTPESQIEFEEGIKEEDIQRLKEMGHNVVLKPRRGNERSLFGNGQIIVRDSQTGVLWAGSDSRTDGCAIGY
eukprot:TRINITY_DN943_c0_g1_i1.p1 TRINITY_DN943_c0_g1~~TRINITY_DN943_c0_g1_i1.p1  ORF type:complete len:584 (+),score=152.61 TRINITY_DN943_c0_g1_i1:86-1753(+)